MASSAAAGNLLSVHPDELKFIVELGKQCYCDLKLVNNTEKHVAFKVKTTSPRKYFVRPNTGVIQPWDSSVIRVTLQAQHEYPPDMQCKDKFLLQCTAVPPHSDVDELPAETFNKESGKTIQESKLKVVYLRPDPNKNSEDGGDDANVTLRRIREERDAACRQTQQLQQELNMLKKRKQQRGGFSLKVALIVTLIGIMVGFYIKSSSSSPTDTFAPDEQTPSME